MSSPIRREADLARLAARERRLRLVMQILSGRDAAYRRSRQPTPPALRQSIVDFGAQLGEFRRDQAQLKTERRSSPQGVRPGRFHRTAGRYVRESS